MDTEIVAISVDDALTLSRTSRELGVRFLLVSDQKRRIINLYGVLHPKEGISRPAVFIIDKRGYVRYRHIGVDYTDRPSIESLIQALSWL